MDELFFAFLRTRREYRSPKSCSRALVGPMREFLQKHGNPEMLKGIADPPPRLVELLADRKVAAKRAANFCAQCGRCTWAERPA